MLHGGGAAPAFAGHRCGGVTIPVYFRRVLRPHLRVHDMTQVPAGDERVRPFLPTRDFDLSKRIYEALGFEKVLDGEVAIFDAGSGGFILQRYYQKDWAENSMMQLMVDDLDAWWIRIDSLHLSDNFGVPAPRSPAMQPWGLRIAYVVDPAGVLWHVAQRRPDAKQDR